MEKLLKSREVENFTPPNPVENINPVLLGQFPAEDPHHSILHYINKSDPRGSAPQNPAQDPMYFYWEQAIQNWLGAQAPKEEPLPPDTTTPTPMAIPLTITPSIITP